MGISRNLRIEQRCLYRYPVRCLMMPKLAPMGRQVVGGRAAELQCHQASDWPVTAAVSAPQCSRNGRAKGGDQHKKSGDLVHDCKGVVGANGVEKRRTALWLRLDTSALVDRGLQQRRVFVWVGLLEDVEVEARARDCHRLGVFDHCFNSIAMSQDNLYSIFPLRSHVPSRQQYGHGAGRQAAPPSHGAAGAHPPSACLSDDGIRGSHFRGF